MARRRVRVSGVRLIVRTRARDECGTEGECEAEREGKGECEAEGKGEG